MVIIDPYRGGSDLGYTNNNIIEKDFNLMISKYIKGRLDELNIPSILTREDDISLSDEERANIINNYSGIGISNRLNYGTENGVEIEYSLKNSSGLSDKIKNAFNERDIYVNKVYQRRDENNTNLDFDDLLKKTKTQTIVINYGYINNNDDINNVIDDYTRYAESVVKGIADYYGINYTKIYDNEYIVKKGDSLYSISKKYNITVDELKKANNLKTNIININQILKIPSPLPSNSYVVQQGDTLYKISKKYNVTVNELKTLNNLSSSLLSIGQVLLIPNGSTGIKYVVKKGDSLYSISKKYNTTVDNIKNKNNLKSNLLSIGQVLYI